MAIQERIGVVAPANPVARITRRDRGSARDPLATSLRRGHGDRTLTLIAVASGLTIVALDSTIVAVAGPALSRHVGASPSGLEWVTNAYLLALAAGVFAGGTLGDRLGRRRVFLLASAGFALASVGCGLSDSLGALVAFRAVQGLCGAVLLAQALAIARATVPPERQAAVLGAWTTTATVVLASGPVIGGLLVAHLGWRSLFFVSLPLAAIALLLGGWAIREAPDEHEEQMLDAPGIGLLTLAMFTLGWGLTIGERHGWDRSHTVAFLLTALLLLGVFAGREAREERYLRSHIPVGLLRSRGLWAGVATIVAIFAALFAVLFYVTLYLERAQGYSALQAGVRILVLSGAVAFSSIVSWAALSKVRPQVLVLSGAVLLAGGLLGLSGLNLQSSYGAVWPFLVLVGLGTGPAQVGAAHAMVHGVQGEQAGIPGRVHLAAGVVGALVGLSVLGSVITTRVSSVLPAKLIAAGVPRQLADHLAVTAHSVAQGVVPVPRGLTASAAHAVTTGSLVAFASGLDTALMVAAAVVLIAGLGAVLLLRATGHGHAAGWSLVRPSQRARG
ncbi:MAG: hypothetical protein QOJ25_1752 [Solirubrobacteraceae bacterium]|jgi:MFS family permease|nr:hypothetical protein [Solirubrobacteraceae bacterium]